jgi:hypothetical protein
MLSLVIEGRKYSSMVNEKNQSDLSDLVVYSASL